MQPTENQILVIFGASGDLTQRKLIPAIYNLWNKKLLPEKFMVIGVSRTFYTSDEFRNKMRENISHLNNSNNNLIDEFLLLLHYIPIKTDEPGDYANLLQGLKNFSKQFSIPENYIFYLASPPVLYPVISESLYKQGLNNESNGWKRLIVEKPFGYDLKTAKELNFHLHRFFDENQLYRIDHYLGKETVQNIMVTRFVNGFYEPVWNRNFIERVEITAAENDGVENRGGYYEKAGALRDMVQNHLFHLLSYVAMEPPASADTNAIHNEVQKVFQCLRIISANEVNKFVIRGQYLESKVSGKSIPGYRQEKNVNPDSKTETFVALKVFIDNWRWADVPFYIRTGKRMPTRVSEVVIYFRPAPYHIFCTNHEIENQINQLIIRIQPDEGLLLKFGMKVPGAGFMVQPVNMDFHYSNLNGTYIPSAYERLLLDCMNGDSTLYSRADTVHETWRFLEPILYAWQQHDSKVYGYPAGTWGPDVVNNLFDKTDQTWRYPCKNLVNDGQYCEL